MTNSYGTSERVSIFGTRIACGTLTDIPINSVGGPRQRDLHRIQWHRGIEDRLYTNREENQGRSPRGWLQVRHALLEEQLLRRRSPGCVRPYDGHMDASPRLVSRLAHRRPSSAYNARGNYSPLPSTSTLPVNLVTSFYARCPTCCGSPSS